jgi:HSP20 family protein
MTLVRYQPWSLLNDVHRGFASPLSSRGQLEDEDNSRVVTSSWVPTVDIKEEQERFVLYADLPGVDVKDIDITMEKGVLSIKGERF